MDNLIIIYGFVALFWLVWHFLLNNNNVNKVISLLLIISFNILIAFGVTKIIGAEIELFQYYVGIIIIAHFVYFSFNLNKSSGFGTFLMIYLLELASLSAVIIFNF